MCFHSLCFWCISFEELFLNCLFDFKNILYHNLLSFPIAFIGLNYSINIFYKHHFKVTYFLWLHLFVATIASGGSKIRRHESLDLTPAKVSSRQRSSAPGIMTSVYKRPLPSTQDTTKRLSQSIKSSRIKQKLLAKKQPPAVPSEESTSNLMKLPPSPAPVLVPPKRSEVTPKVSERSRRVSGTVKDEKTIVSKVCVFYLLITELL